MKTVSPQTERSALDLLPLSERQLLTRASERVFLRAGRSYPLRDGDVAIVESGALSVVAERGSTRLEHALLGPGDIVGLTELGLEDDTIVLRPITETMLLRCSRAQLMPTLSRAPALSSFVLRNSSLSVALAAVRAACNARHSVQQRLAAWALTATDLSGLARIALTHDTLASLLGVRRASITMAMHILEGERGIVAVRGAFGIRDRTALEGCACGCYRAELSVRRRY